MQKLFGNFYCRTPKWEIIIEVLLCKLSLKKLYGENKYYTRS